MRILGSLVLSAAMIIQSTAYASDFPRFDRGPDPEDPMQLELLHILQDMPYVPGISEQLQVLVPSGRGQKMRPDFGAMPLRGFLQPNSISVLVIGQDGTHIAEGANRPGIAGFGGRVHDMLMHFGILEGVFFTNLYINTISGQYGSRATPVVKDGNTIVFQNVIENRQWLMTHDGPYAQWRNRFLSWVIRNNLDSLKMVMMLGQAGKDAGASLINYLGGKVGPRKNIGSGEQFQVPIFKMVNAGGNNEFAMVITAKGEDVAEILRRQPNVQTALIKHLQEHPDFQKAKDNFAKAEEIFKNAKATGNEREIKKAETQYNRAKGRLNAWNTRLKAAKKGLDYRDGDPETGEGASTYNAEFILTNFPTEAIKLMSFSHGGPKRNGVLTPEQFGGWDLNSMQVNGEFTRSIKGLQIPCHESKEGPCKLATSVTAPDIVFVGAPHPTSLSMNEMDKPGSAAVSVENELLTPLKAEFARGWQPPQPEKGLDSPFLEGKSYRYGRGVIPPSHGDPGITDMRLLPVSTAQRDGSSMIIIGTRDGVKFDTNLIAKMEKDLPSNKMLLNSKNILTGRPKFNSWLKEYDRGPNDKYADLLFESLEKQKVLVPKQEFNSEYTQLLDKELARLRPYEDTEDAYLKAINAIYVKYGIDAFNFKSHPEAGFFGHYRGTFEKPKVLILADPMGYDSFMTSKAATGARGQFLHGLMHDLRIDDKYLVISTVPMMMDGANDEEWQEVLDSTIDYRENLIKEVIQDSNPQIILADGKFAAQELRQLGINKFIEIPRKENDPAFGIVQAGHKISSKANITGNRMDIPRSHLTWIARTWEGTSGDRVITATDKGNKGKAYAIVAPNWARQAKPFFTASEQESISAMINKLVTFGEAKPTETVVDFLKRRQNCATPAEKELSNKPPCGLGQPMKFQGVLKEAGSF